MTNATMNVFLHLLEKELFDHYQQKRGWYVYASWSSFLQIKKFVTKYMVEKG